MKINLFLGAAAIAFAFALQPNLVIVGAGAAAKDQAPPPDTKSGTKADKEVCTRKKVRICERVERCPPGTPNSPGSHDAFCTYETKCHYEDQIICQ